MTNIYAFKMLGDKTPHAFVVCDAQSTYQDQPSKDGDALKLVRRGWSLISMTGLSVFRLAYEDIDDSLCYVTETAEKLLKASAPLAKKFESESGTYIVVGFDEAGPAMYEVTATDTKQSKRGIRRIDHWQYANGSGAAKVEPAMEREIEQAHLMIPHNCLEALTLCFAVGSKADQNLYVNDKLQIGMVSPQGSKVIVHPEIKLYGQEWARTYSSTSGENMTYSDTLTDDEKLRRNDIATTIDEFYAELDSAAKRFLNYDRNVNLHNTLLKQGGCTIADYEKAQLMLGKERHAFTPLVDAFTKGNLSDIIVALRTRSTAREERYVRLEKP